MRPFAELTIPNESQSEALEGLIPGYEVVADGIDDQAEELIFLQGARDSCQHHFF
jgi:hypothetical protein